MEAGTIPRSPGAVANLRLLLLAALLALAAIAWVATEARMGDMDAGPGTHLGGLGFFVGVWVVMMAAMMFPSVAPTVLTYAKVRTGRPSVTGSTAVAVAAMLSGYLLAWTAAGVAAYGIFEAVSSLSIDAFGWDEGGPYLAGGIIVAAAGYQLTPLKDVCLRHCRSPLGFLLHRWRDGAGGALRMGTEHGAYCVGCCWMLMAALFALGAMSLGWMALIAGLIALEKLLPWRRVANLGVAVLLLALGIGVALAPDRVPALTLPDSPEASAAMDAMEGMAPATGMEATPEPAPIEGLTPMPIETEAAPMKMEEMAPGPEAAPMKDKMP